MNSVVVVAANNGCKYRISYNYYLFSFCNNIFRKSKQIQIKVTHLNGISVLCYMLVYCIIMYSSEI